MLFAVVDAPKHITLILFLFLGKKLSPKCPKLFIFNGFIIKIVMSGTNEATAPRIRDLRAIALA